MFVIGVFGQSGEERNVKLPPFKYLLERSKNALREFGVNQRGRASGNWKQAREAIDNAIEAEAYALLALWLEEYGEELIDAAAKGDVHADAKDVTPSADPMERELERTIEPNRFRRAG